MPHRYRKSQLLVALIGCFMAASLNGFELTKSRQSNIIQSSFRRTSLTRPQLPRTSRICMTGPDVGVMFYDLQLQASDVLSTQLSQLSTTSFALLFICGLVASFNPCSISMLPLTLAYLGSEGVDTPSSQSGNEKSNLLSRSLFYAFGLSAVRKCTEGLTLYHFY